MECGEGVFPPPVGREHPLNTPCRFCSGSAMLTVSSCNINDLGMIMSSLFVGHQPSGLGEHYVLRPRCAFLLGLDVFCRSNRGMRFLMVAIKLLINAVTITSFEVLSKCYTLFLSFYLLCPIL